MDGIIQLVVFLVLLAIGVFAGRANEKKHYRELQEAEEDLSDVVVSNGRVVVNRLTFAKQAPGSNGGRER